MCFLLHKKHLEIVKQRQETKGIGLLPSHSGFTSYFSILHVCDFESVE